MDINNAHRFRERMQAGETLLGMGVTFADPSICELIAEAGYDFTWIDMEHGAIGIETALRMVTAHRGTGAAPFIRVQWNDVDVIKPVADLAPAGIIVPQVNDAAAAEAAVQACRYPPRGVRGYGPRRGTGYGAIPQADYLAETGNEPIVAIQIEHRDAVANLDEMLEVPGVDIYCLGLNDLSGSFGKLGLHQDPEVVAAVETVAAKVGRSDRVLGISTFYSPETYARWMSLGVRWLNLNVDFSNLYRAAREVIEAAHGQTPNPR